MRVILLAAFAWAALCVGGASRADEGDWRAPSGRYSVRAQATGWTPLPQAPNTLAAFEMTGERQRVRMCFVRERPVPANAPADQERLNQVLPSFVPRRDMVAAAPTSFARDGVTVLAFLYQRDGNMLHYRWFALGGEAPVFVEMSCGGPGDITAADTAAFEAFLNSLRIHNVRETP